MRLIVEDEHEGDEWRGYVTIRVFEDGELLIDAHIAPQEVPDVDEFLEIFELVAEVQP